MDIPEKFTVEQAFTINILFFLNLWPLVELKVTDEEKALGTYSLFFIDVCSGGECSPEWNEAIYRAMNIPKNKQKKLHLLLSEIFLCVLEFCRLHNERYKDEITYAVHLLESMKKQPEKYPNEWTIWEKVIQDTVTKYMNSTAFDWSAELSTGQIKN